MTPAEYVTEIVAPTLRECKDERQSRRRAYLACITVFHVKDHLKEAGETGIEKSMRLHTGEAFDVVRAVCNGAKHVKTDPKHRIPVRAGDDWYRPPAVAGLMVADLSVLGDGDGGREFEHADIRHDIYSCARRVLLGSRPRVGGNRWWRYLRLDPSSQTGG